MSRALIYSNAAFLVPGVLAALAGAWAVAAACVLLGTLSANWHADPENALKRLWDEISMYWLALALIGYWFPGLPWWGILPAWPVAALLAHRIPSGRTIPLLAVCCIGQMIGAGAALQGLVAGSLLGFAFLWLDPHHSGKGYQHVVRHILAAAAVVAAL